MAPPPRLDDRFGVIRANATVLSAALLAAHAASGGSGFRATDVRFFVYVFANWLERDVLYPGESIDLTQVRRLVARLMQLGHARKVGRESARARGGIRSALTPAGAAILLSELDAAVDSRTFEEAVFVVTFVAGYKPELVAMLPRDAPANVARALEPRALLRRARRRVERLLRDVTQRVASSAKVAQEAAHLRRTGATETSIAARLESLGVYQLQHIRSFAGFVLSFPPNLRSFELGPGFDLRSQLMFETLADSVRGQLLALERLEGRLRAGEALRED